MSDGDSGKRLNCLICGIELSTNTSYSIFCTVVPHSGTLLATSVQKVINKHVDKSSLPSSHVCNMCFSLLEDLDLAEEKCNTLRKNILNTFLKHCQTNGFNLDSVPGIACQTEDKVVSETPEPEVVKVKDKGSVEFNEDDDEDNGDNGDNEPEEVTPEKQESSEKVTRSKKNTSAPAPKSSSKPPRNKRKGRPAKKASSGKRSSSPASAAVSSADTSASSSSTPTTTTATITQTSNGKYVIRTKDARRRRRYVHPCSLCGRLFRRPCEVKQHLLSHGGAKPYQCRDCGKRFGSKSGAGIHALKQHGKDVTVEDIIEVCYDGLTGVDVNLTPENIKEIIKLNMKESGLADDHSESNGSTDNDDDDFEWKLEDEDELFKITEDNGEKKDDANDPLRLDSEPSENPPDAEQAPSAVEIEVKEEGIEVASNMEVKKEDEDKMKTMESLKLKLVLNKPGRSKGGGGGGGGGGAAGSGTSGSESTAAKEKPKRKKKKDPLPKPPKHECPLCGKMWRTMSEFKSHVNTHSDERPFICEICGQAYKHKAALDIHVGMHNGINPFCCPYCNKAFTQKGALQRHLPIHTGEAPFQCELCGKRFVHHTSFNMHTLAHTGQKSYKCKVCGLALLSGSHLKRHSRVHTGERPYQCQTCGKRFAERYNLVAHTRVHDPAGSAAKDGSKKVHRCQLCGAGFDRKPKLEDHLALSHNKISDSDDSRKWVGHLITNDVNQHGMPANVPGAPMVQMHQASPVSMVAIPAPEAMGRRDVDLKPNAALASVQMHQALGMGPPPAAAEHHPHQQSWHHMLFGGTSGKMEENMDGTGGAGIGPGGHIDAKMGPLSQHRLLSEMSALGGIGHNMGRNMLQSCLVGAAAAAGHPSLGHPHHIPNPHAGIGPARINMFGGENNNH
ncbi:uncharacterized protein [Anabrus simplex]|uniref:uncharacterized protein n=1 Tax=Anabrus simplex TaxID=316456 RepID=UPI0035A2FC59